MMLGAVLKDWRTMNRLDQKEAAQVIGIEPGTLGNIENGRGVSVETFMRVLGWLAGPDKPVAIPQQQLALAAPQARAAE